MDKTLRNSIIAGIIIVTLSVSYYLVIFLPKKEVMRLKQQELSASLNADKKEQPTEYVSPINQTPDLINSQQISDLDNTEEDNQISTNNESVGNITDEEYKKSQKKTYEAQLKIDKQVYNDAIEKLTRDYNHAVDALRVKEASEGGRQVSDSDCGGNGVQIQECAIAQRIHDKYQVEYDYLEATYKANLKAIEATKYW